MESSVKRCNNCRIPDKVKNIRRRLEQQFAIQNDNLLFFIRVHEKEVLFWIPKCYCGESLSYERLK